jgi:2'-5' RNA ligase
VALFLAAWPSPVLATSLLPDALRAGAGLLATLRPVPVADRHATLLYLGACPIEPVLAVFDARVAGPGGKGLDACGLGPVDAVVGAETVALGPGALVVPVAGLVPLAGALRHLAEEAGLSVVPAGPPARGFVGHVTVARPLRATARRSSAAALRAASGLAVPGAEARWRVAEVVLAASEPIPDGVERTPGGRYGIVRRVVLG